MGIPIPADIQRQLDQARNMEQQNVLTALIYSMMPWVNPVSSNNNNNNNDGNNDEKKDNNDNQG